MSETEEYIKNVQTYSCSDCKGGGWSRVAIGHCVWDFDCFRLAASVEWFVNCGFNHSFAEGDLIIDDG